MPIQGDNSLRNEKPHQASSKPRNRQALPKMKRLRGNRRARSPLRKARRRINRLNSSRKPPLKVLRPKRPRRSLPQTTSKVSLSSRAIKIPSSKRGWSLRPISLRRRACPPTPPTIKLSAQRKHNGRKRLRRLPTLPVPKTRSLKPSKSCTPDLSLKFPRSPNRKQPRPTSKQPKTKSSTTKKRKSKRWQKKKRQPTSRQKSRRNKKLYSKKPRDRMLLLSRRKS